MSALRTIAPRVQRTSKLLGNEMKLHPHFEIPNATPTDSGSVLLSHVGILILYSKQLLSEKNRKYYILVYLVGSFLS